MMYLMREGVWGCFVNDDNKICIYLGDNCTHFGEVNRLFHGREFLFMATGHMFHDPCPKTGFVTQICCIQYIRAHR